MRKPLHRSRRLRRRPQRLLLRRPASIFAAAALFLLMTCSAPLAPDLSKPQLSFGQRTPDPAVLAVAEAPTALAGNGSREPAPAATAAPLQGQANPLATPTLTPGALALPTPSPSNERLRADLDRYLADLTANGYFSGAVLVARDGQVILAQGYGADRGAANTDKTRFRLASLTKQFTAAAILMLQRDGKLAIDDPICNYLDNCPDAWRPVTIRELLNHTSGIIDYTDFMDFDATEGQPATPQQLIARFREFPLTYEPGTLYDYCNSGYVLLGVIIENVSGRSYPDFIQRSIFNQLGMVDSGYDDSTSQRDDIAAGYSGPGVQSGFLNATTLFAAGGLYSNVWDLYRWDQALYGDDLLSGDLRAQMFTPGNGSYGFGWKIERPNGLLRISHAGNMTGVSNFIARYPEQRVTVIVLSNLEFTNAALISDYAASQVIGATP